VAIAPTPFYTSFKNLLYDHETNIKIMEILEKLEKEIQELENLNTEKSCAKAEGMRRVVNSIGKYVEGYRELDCYFDSISDEEQVEVHQRLTDLGMYDPD
jgi:hypothetical protein